MSALRGRRIVVTRAEEQAASLRAALEAAGAEVIQCSTIRVVPPESFDALDRALSRLDEYRWVVFTSTNGVRAVLARMAELRVASGRLDGSRVAAVGSSTAGALEGGGLRVAFVPAVERSRSLAAALHPVEGERILLPRADIADEAVAATLRDRGAERVDDVVAYRTLLVPPSPRALRELRSGVDGITFTSPSTVRGFLQMGEEWRELLAGVVVATLGPATTEAARQEGVRVDVEATKRSMSGLVDALDGVFASRSRRDEESAE